MSDERDNGKIIGYEEGWKDAQEKITDLEKKLVAKEAEVGRMENVWRLKVKETFENEFNLTKETMKKNKELEQKTCDSYGRGI